MHKRLQTAILYAMLAFCFSLSTFEHVSAQKIKADSTIDLLRKEKKDSNKVNLLCKLAGYTDIYNPDTAVFISQQALYLARKIKYTEGESQSLGVLANSFIKYGNYPRALRLSLEKLQLEEKRHIPENMASVMISIGVIYVLQKDFENALLYYRSADSMINLFKIDRLRYFTSLNIGDVFNRMNVSDSAHIYFARSLRIAQQKNDLDFIGTSYTGLGHSFLKLKNFDSSLYCYQNAVHLLKEMNDDETYCEATLGIANLFLKLNEADSAKLYAYRSYITAQNKFPLKELEAVQFLSDFYKSEKNTDSAFAYLNKTVVLNDSINNANRIRELQTLSTNEKFRQYEIEEANKTAREERMQRLQLLFIGIFIPGLFAITLLLSRVRVPVRVIRVLGIVSLLFFFEYITILLHPAVENLTHHTPWIEILIFVSLGAVLVPAHHRMEHWVIHRLLASKIKPTITENETAPELFMEDENITEEDDDDYDEGTIALFDVEESIPAQPAGLISDLQKSDEEIKKADT